MIQFVSFFFLHIKRFLPFFLSFKKILQLESLYAFKAYIIIYSARSFCIILMMISHFDSRIFSEIILFYEH